MGLVVIDVAVLVVFIDHIAKSIQLPQVIASIARDLSRAIDAEGRAAADRARRAKAGPSLSETARAPGRGQRRRARAEQRLSAVREHRHVDRHRRAQPRGDPSAPSARALPRRGRAAGRRLARRRGTHDGAGRSAGRTPPARTGPHAGPLRSRSTSSSRSRSERSRRRSTTPSRRSPASTGSATRCARSPTAGSRRPCIATKPAACA